jgi:hypothetical protein
MCAFDPDCKTAKEIRSSLDKLTSQLNGFENNVHAQFSSMGLVINEMGARLARHDRIVRWVERAALLVLGLGIGAGVVEPAILEKLLAFK